MKELHEETLRSEDLRSLTTNAASQLDVLRHDGDALSVDGAQVGVLFLANRY